MDFPPSGDKRNPANRTEGRLDPADLRETTFAESLLTLSQKFPAAGALRREKKLKRRGPKFHHSLQWMPAEAWPAGTEKTGLWPDKRSKIKAGGLAFQEKKEKRRESLSRLP